MTDTGKTQGKCIEIRKVKVKSLSHVWLLVTPWTATYQAPPTMGFSRREYWSGLPLPKEDHKYILISVSQRHWFGSVQSFSCVCLFATPWTEAHQASLSITISRSLLKLMSTGSVHDAIQPSHLHRPLLLLPSIFPSIRAFSSESVLCIRWPKYWRFSFNLSLSNAYSGLISFRIDWFDLLAVQGTLKSLFQHQSSKASVLGCLAFLMVQFSHPYMTIGKTIAVTIRNFVDRVMSLLFNVLSKFVIAFLPRIKCLLVSWLQSPFVVILEPKIIKFVTVSIVFPSIWHEVMGPDAKIFIFWILSFKPAFSLSSFTFIKRRFSSSSLACYIPIVSISSKWSLEMLCLNFQNLWVFDISLMIMCFITLKHYGI